jgi:hypothetical protein
VTMTRNLDALVAGLEEPALVEAPGRRERPPPLSGQPIRYPVLNEKTRP